MAIQGGLSSGALAGSANDQVQPDPVDGSQIAQGNQGALQNIVPYSPNTAIVPYPSNTALNSLNESLIKLQTQRNALDAQTELLLTRLNERQNRLLNPVLLGAAAGFLKPTTTGSFGESLGYAMANTADELNKEFTRDQATEKLKQELMEKQMEQAQLRARQSFLMSKLSPQGVPTPSGPLTSISTPTGAASQRTPGAPMAAQAAGQVAAALGSAGRGLSITSEDIKQANLFDPSGKDAKFFTDLMKAEIDREKMLQETDPHRIVEVDFGPLIGAPKKIPYSTYIKWLEIHNSGDRAAELKFFYDRNWIKRPPGAKPGDEPPDAAQRALEAKVVEARRTKQVEEESVRIGKLENNFETSRDFINAARGMRELATSNKRALDLMNDDGVATAVMRAAKAGIQAGQFGSISVPTDVLYQGVKLSKEDREALQLFAQEYAKLTVQFRKAARVPGEGATTEREGDLYAALGALPTDTARVIRMKSEFIETKGKYDQEVFRAWNKFSKDPRNSYRDFLASGELQAIKEAYDTRLGEMQKANSNILGRRAKSEARSNERVINGTIWKRQEDGSWKDSGKKAP